MPSPACTVSDNGGGAVSTLNGVDVANDGTTVTIILADQGGVRTWSCAIVDTDDQVAAPTVTVNETNKTASFTKPAGPWAIIFQSQINGGVNLDGVEDPTYTTTFGIYIKTTSKHLRLGAANERAEGSAAFGWTTKINDAIRGVESGGGGGSGAIAWQYGTGAAPAIAVPASSTPQGAWFHGVSSAGSISLPATPTDGETLDVVDEDGTAVQFGIVISRGGTDVIIGPDGTSATTFTFSTAAHGYAAGATLHLIYSATRGMWKVT